MDNLEIFNNINLSNNLNNENEQIKFLETSLGKTINTGINLGIRTLLPDFIEEQIIDLKDNLLKYGLKDGIKRSIDDAINIGKSTLGIVTGNFDSIYQIQEAIKKGGIIDNISGLMDNIIDKLKNSGIIKNNIAKIIKQGKNTILNNVEKNIENKFSNQIKSLNYTEKYIDNWKQYFNNKDFDGMEREYKKLQTEIKNLVPIEKTINEVRHIENIHNLVKNNGKNFNISNEEIELSRKL